MDYNGVGFWEAPPPLSSEQEKTSEIPTLNFAFA